MYYKKSLPTFICYLSDTNTYKSVIQYNFQKNLTFKFTRRSTVFKRMQPQCVIVF